MRDITREPDEMFRQLYLIGALQRRLLPREVPRPPGWTVAVHYAVGAWPGGDYYDFLPLADGRLLVFAGDASDEGGPSAVLVALARATIHSCPLSSGQSRLPFCQVHGEVVQSPHVILGNLNRVLAENSLEDQYLTAFCGVLSPAEGTLHYANAAYPPPLWWRAARGSLEPVNEATGMPLGISPGSAYHHRRIVIEPGDLLVLCSDGLTASQDRRGTLFGTQSLDDVVRELAPAGAEAVRDGLVRRLDNFLAGHTPHDDVTVVVLGRDE
jgi:sigma-B regulation protein RsbU (phosphoserine phosphatase)